MTEAMSVTRESIRTPRAAAVAGIVFSVLLTVAFVLVRLALPSDSDDAAEWLTDGRKRDALLLASNGRVVATSETYESKESCLKGIAAVKRLAADASVIEVDAAPTASRENLSAQVRRQAVDAVGGSDGLGRASEIPACSSSRRSGLARVPNVASATEAHHLHGRIGRRRLPRRTMPSRGRSDRSRTSCLAARWLLSTIGQTRCYGAQ